MKPQTLYIIGNGFDIFHGLNTRYTSFGIFLKDKYYKLYDYFIKYFGLPDLDENNEDDLYDPLWSQFEAELANLNIEEVLIDHEEFAANPMSDDFSEGDWDTIAVMVDEIRESLTTQMLTAFKEFINKVEYVENQRLLNLERNALFLSFNYTNTLSKYYKVERTQICFIHNKADESSPLVLGHAFDPSQLKENDPRPPQDLSEEELGEWYDRMAEMDLSIEKGKTQLSKYFKQSYKSAESNIATHIDFFNSLENISKIFVLGHSLADVDQPYFKKIVEMTNLPEWIVSYYNINEQDQRRQILKDIGVKESQIHLVTLAEL